MMQQLRADQVGGQSREPTVFRALSETRYVLTVPALELSFEIDRLHRERNDLCGELIVKAPWGGAGTFNGILWRGRFNLDSGTTRNSLAKQLRERAKLPKEDHFEFAPLLDELCIRVSEADRAGQPAIDLSTLPMPSEAPTLQVAGFTLWTHHPQIVFGDGGTAKSLFALYLAGELVLQHGHTVIFADWELDEGEHRRRLGQLFGVDLPRVFYVRCDKPLVYEVDRIKRIGADVSASFMFADSVGFGSNGKPEDAVVANEYIRALRQIGLGSFNVAHITKDHESNDQKPFGSAFWHNGARATWFVKAGDTTPAGLSIGLYNRKANLGPKLPPLAYDIDFSNGRTTFMRTAIEDIESLAVGLPLWQRIKQAVRHKPQTIVALAEELDASKDTIDRTVRRMRQVFTRVSGQDGASRIALVTRDAA